VIISLIGFLSEVAGAASITRHPGG
jgi:hypothetical protein